MRRELIRPLTKQEIDRRIGHLVAHVATSTAGAVDGATTEVAPEFEPRWISAADLVRRLRPFLVYN